MFDGTGAIMVEENYVIRRGPQMMRWRKGNPPSIGWWPASVKKISGVLRWWDGEQWSAAVYQNSTAEEAERYAAIPSIHSKEVLYQLRPLTWPKASYT